MRRRSFIFATVALASGSLARAQKPAPFDHSHEAWTALLAKHVKTAADGRSSRVNYRGFAAHRGELGTYLATLSAVDPAEYARWSKPQQYAFLANAYNAFTVEKVLTRYPNLSSIRDFGRFVANPWKDRFFTLLGKRQNLDGVEHDTMRAAGVFDDPRVHVAVNCASIGCPMLGSEALTADRLDQQLERLMRAFLSDRSRNRYDAQSKTLELSMIFDWYGDDFKGGGKSFLAYPRFGQLWEVGARYADLLADAQADRTRLRTSPVPIRFLEYDWRLNSVDERSA